MGQGIIEIDLQKCEASYRKIITEYDKLKNMADRLSQILEATSIWWKGDSRIGFKHMSDEFIADMRSSVDNIGTMCKDIATVIKEKQETEERLKSVLDSMNAEVKSNNGRAGNAAARNNEQSR